MNKKVLKALAENEKLTVRQIVYLVFKDIDKDDFKSEEFLNAHSKVSQSLRVFRKYGYVKNDKSDLPFISYSITDEMIRVVGVVKNWLVHKSC